MPRNRQSVPPFCRWRITQELPGPPAPHLVEVGTEAASSRAERSRRAERGRREKDSHLTLTSSCLRRGSQADRITSYI